MLKIGSLFSGMAGLDRAVESITGGVPTWFCEFDAAPSKILAKHYPNVPNYGDITKIDWATIEPVDILTGGFPAKIYPSPAKELELKKELAQAYGSSLQMLLNNYSQDWWSLKMSEDYLAQQPTAIWNSVRGVWEKPGMANLLCEHWALFSEVWPSSGMMQNGQASALQMPVRLTADSEFSLLPTAAVAHLRNHDEPLEDYLQRRNDFIEGRTTGMPGASLGVAVRLAQRGIDWKDDARRLPTPTVADTFTDKLQSSQQKEGSMHSVNLSQAVHMDWGMFLPALQRWEMVMGRKAPSATVEDENGEERLSPKFAEWMMGLPDGWITDCGLTRKEELKICGNGVVTQQAELALSVLLEGVEF